MITGYSPDKDELQSLMNTALGNEKAELVINNGNLVNVVTAKTLQGWSVAIKGKWIAYVGENADHTIGPDTTVIDATGKSIIPGLIDGHAHLLWYYNLDEFLKYTIRGGTTTIITDTDEIGFAIGYQGIIEFLQSAKNQPIKLFATIAPMANISPAAEANSMDIESLKNLLTFPEVLGLGETYWSVLQKNNARILEYFAETLAAGKKIEGHAAGARGNKLVAYLAAGVSSCHESTTVEEVKERLNLGIHTMIREGDIRMELPEISAIKNDDIDTRRLILVTDGIGPRRLMNDGYMEFVLQRAIDFGIDPITAIQMCTLNVAEHFGIDNIVGSISPCKHADMVILPDLKHIDAEYVISAGQIIAHNRVGLVPPLKPNFSRNKYRSMQIEREMEASDFAIPVEKKNGKVKVRVIDMITDLVSREAQLEMPVSDGEIKVDTDKDIIKISVITTSDNQEKIFTGLVRGFKMKTGALATTMAGDSCAIVIVGANEQDMADAANKILAMNGGIIVISDGEIKAELPLHIGGILSDLPMEVIAQIVDSVQQHMEELGCDFPDAHLTLTFFTSPAIPFIRISEEGLVDTRNLSPVELIVQ